MKDLLNIFYSRAQILRYSEFNDECKIDMLRGLAQLERIEKLCHQVYDCLEAHEMSERVWKEINHHLIWFEIESPEAPDAQSFIEREKLIQQLLRSW